MNDNNRPPMLEKLNRCPPFLVYALARVGKRQRVRQAVICTRSGLSLRTVSRLASTLQWDAVKMGVMDAFCRACNVDPLRMAHQWDYLRNTMRQTRPFAHLSKRELAQFNRLSQRWAELQQTNKNNANDKTTQDGSTQDTNGTESDRVGNQDAQERVDGAQ